MCVGRLCLFRMLLFVCVFVVKNKKIDNFAVIKRNFNQI